MKNRSIGFRLAVQLGCTPGVGTNRFACGGLSVSTETEITNNFICYIVVYICALVGVVNVFIILFVILVVL